MHLNAFIPLTCLLVTLAAAAPTPLSPVNPLAPHILGQRAPGAGVLGFDGGKRDALPEPARKGHFGGTENGKREASPGSVGREGLIVGNHKREAAPAPAGKGRLGGPDGKREALPEPKGKGALGSPLN